MRTRRDKKLLSVRLMHYCRTTLLCASWKCRPARILTQSFGLEVRRILKSAFVRPGNSSTTGLNARHGIQISVLIPTEFELPGGSQKRLFVFQTLFYGEKPSIKWPRSSAYPVPNSGNYCQRFPREMSRGL